MPRRCSSTIVIMMTGISASSGSCRSAANTDQPSRSGIMTSSVIAVGRNSLASLSPAAPLSSLVLAIGLTTANAADIRGRPPVYRAPPPAPPPVYYFSWTGCYFGGHIGGVWARKDWTVRDPAFPSFLGQSDGSHRVDGWLGGVQAGCDYQF